jgi:hypothetical protein
MKGESSAPYKKRKVLEASNETNEVTGENKSSNDHVKRKRTKSAKAEANDDTSSVSHSLEQSAKEKRKSNGSVVDIIDSSFITQDQLAFAAVVSQKAAVWTPAQV